MSDKKLSPLDNYKKWWLDKYCRVAGYQEFKLVTDIKFLGPPSQVYGIVLLYFSDGTNVVVHPSSDKAFKPRKSDVEVREGIEDE